MFKFFAPVLVAFVATLPTSSLAFEKPQSVLRAYPAAKDNTGLTNHETHPEDHRQLQGSGVFKTQADVDILKSRDDYLTKQPEWTFSQDPHPECSSNPGHLVMDNNYNTIYHTCSGASNFNYWQVDFGSPYEISDIIIVNRLDGWQHRLNDATVQLLDSEDTVLASRVTGGNSINFGWSPNFPTTSNVQKIKIIQPNKDALNFAEIYLAGTAGPPPSGTCVGDAGNEFAIYTTQADCQAAALAMGLQC